MSSIWIKSAALVASAALMSLAVVPAIAQREEAETQNLPTKTQEEVPIVERQSKPTETEGTPKELRLQSDNAIGVCTTKADSPGEAAENCKKNLNCRPPAAPDCKRRPNFDDYRCTCK